MNPFLRRIVLAVLLLLGVGLALRQWSAPSSAWACDQIVTCRSAVALDLKALEFDGAAISWQAFDLSPDGTEVVAGFITSDSPIRNDDRLLIGTFSTESGELLSTLVSQELVEYVAVDEVRYSPDGSLIAAVWYQTVGQLEVFDAATGDLVATVIQNENLAALNCNGSLAISPSNDSVQCGSVVLDMAGEVLSSDQPLADTTGGSVAYASSGLIADGFGQRQIDIGRRRSTSTEQLSVVDPAPLQRFDRSLQAFASTTADVERFVLLQDATAWGRTDPRPRRSHTGARLSVYSVETGQLQWSADLADPTSGLAVAPQGMVATISTDGFVMIFAID